MEKLGLHLQQTCYVARFFVHFSFIYSQTSLKGTNIKNKGILSVLEAIHYDLLFTEGKIKLF